MLALVPLLLHGSVPMVLPVACDMRFNGQPGQILDQSLPAAPHTLSLFVRAENKPEAQVLIALLNNADSPAAGREDYAVLVNPNGGLVVKLGTEPSAETFETTGVDVTNGNFHFVAIQFFPEEVVIIVDGLEAQHFVTETPRWISALSATQPGAAVEDHPTVPASQRRGQLALGHRMHGQLSEMLLWSPPLCIDQIKRLRAAAMGRDLCAASADDDDGATALSADDEEPPAPVVAAAPRAAPASLPAQLLRCLHAVTVGVDVHGADGTVTTLSTSKTLVSEQLIAAGAQGEVALDCSSVLRGVKALAFAAERAFAPDGFAGLAVDAAIPAARPHTHLFTLAKTDPALLDDATQVLVMGIMAGMVASVCSILFGLAVGCWAGMRLAKAAVRPIKLV